MARGDTRAADEILADDYVDHDIPGRSRRTGMV
jgi:hypothetical protein